jgi:peptidoglycan/LPS O-acetylase OafA/YrhL
MTKWATYSIVVALFAMLLPFLFMALDAIEMTANPLFPIIALFFGGLGVLIHLFSMLKSDTINGSGLLLLTSILSIIYGFSLSSLGIKNAKYLLLIGALLVAVWIMVPNKKKED